MSLDPKFGGGPPKEDEEARGALREKQGAGGAQPVVGGSVHSTERSEGEGGGV